MSAATLPATAAEPLREGAKLPDFTLPVSPEKKVSLSDYRGQTLILAFYPADWSPVCGDQVTLYNEVLPDFEAHRAQILGVSVDGPWCHRAFAEARKLRFALLADFEPKGAFARACGVYREGDGTSERALFVVDGTGTIRWSYVSPIGVNPGADGILEALEKLDAEKGKA